MTTTHLTAIVAAFGLTLGIGYSLYKNSDTTDSPIKNETVSTQAMNKLPDFAYSDLQGNTRSSTEWSDKIVVLNFWATWCPPCRKETPAFIETQEKYADNVQFVGIAIDDKELVQDFADEFGINYPTLLGGMEAVKISQQLGNRFSGLPFTAIFDKNGNLVYQHTGEVEKDALQSEIKALL